MRDFCKVFEVEGLGQILAVREEDDEERPCVRFRIPDMGGMMLSVSVSAGGEDYDAAETCMQSLLEELDEAKALKMVRPLLDIVHGVPS